MLNGDVFLIALYDVLGNLYEDYKLSKELESLWELVDKKVNSSNINWEEFRKANHVVYSQMIDQLEEVYKM